MKAKIVGIKRTDFTGDNGQVKRTSFHVVIDKSSDVDEGQSVDMIGWDELQDGKPPAELKVGAEVQVQYNKKGKLSIVA